MTIRNKIQNKLVNLGLWPKEAESVIAQLEAGPASAPMKGRWDEDATAYPPQLLAVLFMAARTEAVKWIDANKPQHFARGLLNYEIDLIDMNTTPQDIATSAAVNLQWRVHTYHLLKEITDCSNMSIYHIPLNILGKLLAAVGERAIELNDQKLNALMCRLTIYTVADPGSPDYDPDTVRAVMQAAITDGELPTQPKARPAPPNL